jgi:hypothetical protein
MKKPTHGGKRKGSGRKTGYRKPKSELKEETKVMRIPISKIKAVETIISNEGKKVEVDHETFQALMAEYENGLWMSIVKVKGQPHVIILTENFQ